MDYTRNGLHPSEVAPVRTAARIGFLQHPYISRKPVKCRLYAVGGAPEEGTILGTLEE